MKIEAINQKGEKVIYLNTGDTVWVESEEGIVYGLIETYLGVFSPFTGEEEMELLFLLQ